MDAKRLTARVRRGGIFTVALVLFVCGGSGAVDFSSNASASDHFGASSTADCDSLATCYTPHDLEAAYGIEPLLKRGIDGKGETVVLPEFAAGPPVSLPVSDLRSDLRDFDKLFNLPAARLIFDTSIAGSNVPYLANGEEVLDAEMVHAIAPGVTITILRMKSNSLNDPANAVSASVSALRRGATLGGIISMSAVGQTGGERCDSPSEVSALNAALQFASADHVTVVAASGDIGVVGEPCALLKGLVGGKFPPVREVNLPASDPLVLGVGGTSLYASHATGAYESETVWGLPYGNVGTQFQASGGGYSDLFPRPSYQAGVPGIGSYRGVPDVSADANGHTGMLIVTSTGANRYSVRNSGGTSASAPLWAAIIALADQYAGRDLGLVNPAIYAIARSAHYSAAFHDVTAGSNGASFPSQHFSGYKAVRGWNAAAGWGSPDAQNLVPLLARYDQG
ncbi:MAG: S53 family peptidase [Acidimicrobiales bacterium]